MAGELGIDIDLGECEDVAALAGDVALFSESCGRFVVTTKEADAAAFAERLRGLPCRRVGRVTDEPRLRVRCGGRTLLDNDLTVLKQVYKVTLSDV